MKGLYVAALPDAGALKHLAALRQTLLGAGIPTPPLHQLHLPIARDVTLARQTVEARLQALLADAPSLHLSHLGTTPDNALFAAVSMAQKTLTFYDGLMDALEQRGPHGVPPLYVPLVHTAANEEAFVRAAGVAMHCFVPLHLRIVGFVVQEGGGGGRPWSSAPNLA